MKILIAHDQAGNCRIIKSHLKKQGYQVIVSKNHEDAIHQVEAQHPDVIITDLIYSSSAFNLISEVKKGSGSKIPILVLSALGRESLVEHAFELGADDYISQSNKLNELSLRINILAKGRTRATA